MKYKPIDEMSLRHLFSTAFAEEILKLSYLGPVLNPSGSIETSPDCNIFDKRNSPFRIRRCEFKYIASGIRDFKHNGSFDIAIVWSISPNLSKKQLLNDLLKQNGCSELIIMEDYKAFRELPAYTNESLKNLGNIDFIKKLVLKRKLPSVFALYIAANLYPKTFQMDKMVDFLSNRFPNVKKMQPRGRANVVSAFIQTKPPLLEQVRKNTYRWINDVDSKIVVALLNEIIINNFFEIPPSKDDIDTFRE